MSDRHLPVSRLITALELSTAAATEHALTLRQQQVDRLKQEMFQPDGMKVRVKRKDCLDALALVDCFGCVW